MRDTPKSPTNMPRQCHSEKCPVCNGFTTVNYGKQTCAACKGKGYVIVPDFLEKFGDLE